MAGDFYLTVSCVRASTLVGKPTVAIVKPDDHDLTYRGVLEATFGAHGTVGAFDTLQLFLKAESSDEVNATALLDVPVQQYNTALAKAGMPATGLPANARFVITATRSEKQQTMPMPEAGAAPVPPPESGEEAGQEHRQRTAQPQRQPQQPAAPAAFAAQPPLKQRRPWPALLLCTYGQLQSEVQHGILDHFAHPRTYSWRGSQFKLKKEVASEQTLPQHVRTGLILAGCGFPVEQLPVDLRQALLDSSHTAPDLRAALQNSLHTAASSMPGMAVHSTTSNAASPSTIRALADQLDPYTSCSAWAECFMMLCAVSAELGLPLAMHPRLPWLQQQEQQQQQREQQQQQQQQQEPQPQPQRFMQQLLQAGCPKLTAIMERQRAFLHKAAREWPLRWAHTSTSSTDSCIVRAVHYQPQNFAELSEPHSCIVLDCSQVVRVGNTRRANGNPRETDIPGAGSRIQRSLRCILGEAFQQLPWLGKNSASGVVLSGGALGSYMAKGAGTIANLDYDLFVIANDVDTYERIITETRAVLDSQAAKLDGQGTAPDGPQSPSHHGWAWMLPIDGKSIGLSKAHGVVAKLFWWPYCSPEVLVRSCDVPSLAAWFDGGELSLDERCAWCHANRLLLADPMFDNVCGEAAGSPGSVHYQARLLKHALRLPGYRVLIPGPFCIEDLSHIIRGATALQVAAKVPASTATGSLIAADSRAASDLRLHYRLAARHSIQRATGLARWVVLLVCCRLSVVHQDMLEYAAVSCTPALCESSSTPEVVFATAMGGLEGLRKMGWPFSGFFSLPWGGALGAAAGDANTWFSCCELEELPRHMWLGLHDPGLKDPASKAKP